ncbi:Transcription initiation factor TFIID subunit 12 [Nowakowskiella sp. JEL0407]|nr:Transcription initiation factor TFIID subunit 12 [Nowakowskiella sp. JEL0407]
MEGHLAQYTNKPLLPKQKLKDLATKIDPQERLDPELEDLFTDVAKDFVEEIAEMACKLAVLRKSESRRGAGEEGGDEFVLDVKDFALPLERNYNMKIPGFFEEEDPKRRKKNVQNDESKYQTRLEMKRNSQRSADFGGFAARRGRRR